jgi:hypothetical protein
VMVAPVFQALHGRCECSAGKRTLLVDKAALFLRRCPITNKEKVEKVVRDWLLMRVPNFRSHGIFKLF